MIKLYPALLFISGLFCFFCFPEMYELPLHDEAFYSQGKFASFPDWGPLYHLAYYCTNLVTGSRIQSFYFLSGFTGLILVPILSYFLANKFLKNAHQSFVISSLSYLALWNMPSNPKIQIFNLTLILIAFILRQPPTSDSSKRTIASYLILTTSIFCRFDNFIILFILMIFDFYSWAKIKKTKLILISNLAILTSFYILISFFGNPVNKTRNWRAFVDHFFWRNPDIFVGDIKPGEDYATVVKTFFDNSESIVSAAMAKPLAISNHIFKNLIDLPFYIWKNFQIPTLWAISPLIILGFILILVLMRDENNLDSQAKSELKLFVSSATLKCLATALILQPAGKYVFEMNFCILLIIASIKIPSFKIAKKKFIHLSLPMISVAICLFYFQRPVFFKEAVSINDSLKALKKIEETGAIKHFLGNEGFLIWYESDAPYINLWPDRRFDRAMASNLNHFLSEQNIDVVLIDPSQRYLFKIIGIDQQFLEFERSPENFGFALKYRSNYGPLSIFQRIPR